MLPNNLNQSLHEMLASQTEAFLLRGGKIETVETKPEGLIIENVQQLYGTKNHFWRVCDVEDMRVVI